VHRSIHQEAWETGGHTNETNLLALCSRHHHGKHDAGWTPKRLPDGTIEWISPTGHRYVEEPATYPIDYTTHHRHRPNPNRPKPTPTRRRPSPTKHQLTWTCPRSDPTGPDDAW